MGNTIKVPNIGDFKEVEIIEILVKEGDQINKGDPIITLESDKSSVEVPSTVSGKILKINIKIGDKVSEGDEVLEIQSESKEEESPKKENEDRILKKDSGGEDQVQNIEIINEKILSDSTGASPHTLTFARYLGVNVTILPRSGRGGRVKQSVLKEFIQTNQINHNDPKKSEHLDFPYAHY